MIFNVLVVDDEPFIVDSIMHLLSTRLVWPVELYCAYRGSKAIEIMENTRIDLLITDINMPGMTGLQLISVIRNRWASCRCIVLTGYSYFEYAREAVDLHAVAYLLKTDADQKMIDTVNATLDSLDRELSNPMFMDSIATKADTLTIYDKLFQSALNTHNANVINNVLPALGFSESYPYYYVILSHFTSSHTNGILQKLRALFMSYLLNVCSVVPVHIPDSYQTLWLLQFSVLPTRAYMSGSLELIQKASLASGDLSFFCAPFVTGTDDLAYICEKIMAQAQFVCQNNTSAKFIVFPLGSKRLPPTNVFQTVMDYIDDHIRDDITIDTLAQVTNYNGDYLSYLFRNTIGTPLGRYLVERKLAHIKQIMLQKELSLHEVMEMSGFSSRSYFNRFIKRESGMTPQELRNDLFMSTDTAQNS